MGSAFNRGEVTFLEQCYRIERIDSFFCGPISIQKRKHRNAVLTGLGVKSIRV